MAAIKTPEEYQKEFLKASEENMKKAIADNDALYDNQKATTTELYEGQISDTEKAYEADYRENAIQKLINERQVAESMANMGLTDSGLNRTQQTAVQLSYANNRANIDRQKQSQVDALAREMTSQLAGIEQNRLSSNSSIKSTYEKNAWDNAVSAYNTDVEAETAKYKAEQERLAKEYEAKQERIAAQTKSTNEYNLKMAELNAKNGDGIYHLLRSETDKNGKNVMVFSLNGKEVKVEKGTNPYTDNNNTKNKRASTYGFFGNGYQPKGIVAADKTDYGELSFSGNRSEYTGKSQKIWESNNEQGKHYWLWLGDDNAYMELKFEYDPKEKKNVYRATNNIIYF